MDWKTAIDYARANQGRHGSFVHPDGRRVKTLVVAGYVLKNRGGDGAIIVACSDELLQEERYVLRTYDWYLGDWESKGFRETAFFTFTVSTGGSDPSIFGLVADLDRISLDPLKAWRDPNYPGTCPSCGAPAYVGAVPAAIDCSSPSCSYHKVPRNQLTVSVKVPLVFP